MTSSDQKAPLVELLERLERNGAETQGDAVLSLFLEYVDSLGLELYPAQEEAILELLEWKHVILNTPTGSGKSLVAAALHFQAMAEERVSYYTCPIKALTNEKFFYLCDLFGPENVGLKTGDAAVNQDAPIICCTAEILANMALRDDGLEVDYVVMDEFHFYGDPERGSAWQIPLISMRDTVFLMMSATLGDTSHISSRLADFTEREVATISSAERPVPLEFEYRETPIQETIQDLLDSGEAPVYSVNFTQRACAEQAQSLTSLNVCSKEDKAAIAGEMERTRFDTPYGKELRRFLGAGIGVHHAGLLPKYRLLVERLSQSGLLKVICGTDSLGVGVNIPIRCVVFRSLSKYDGEKTRLLTAREFHQISGRAGRKGFDDHGRAVVQAPEHVIENKRIEAKLVKNPHLKKKLRRQKPPARGYVHWDRSTFERLVQSMPEPLEPRFQVDHGMLVNALESGAGSEGGGYRRLMRLIRRSHGSDGQKRYIKRRAAMLFRSLKRAEIVEIVPRQGRPGAIVRVRPDLQYNFSLNQALSLYLVEALDLLDPESETHALDILSLVEAVLENPQVILFRQTDRLKDELMARLKAEGVGYEQRIAELEKVEYPKPLGSLIYESFNMFARHHPWVDQENIQPKSVAREMFERYLGFNEYVDELGIARSEGVLLRYLSQAYKAAVQTVPETHWTDELEEIQAFLQAVVRSTDSSLLNEWERLMRGEIITLENRYDPPRRAENPADMAADFKKFSARIRSELFMLLKSLATKSYERACMLVRQTDENSWSADGLAEAMAPYFDEHASIDVTPRARQTDNTSIQSFASCKWRVQQKIVDPEGDEDWALKVLVDLSKPTDPDGPLIELEAIEV